MFDGALIRTAQKIKFSLKDLLSRHDQICRVLYFSFFTHLLKFSNRNTKKRCEICSKLTVNKNAS